jgi:hypothetical protein
MKVLRLLFARRVKRLNFNYNNHYQRRKFFVRSVSCVVFNILIIIFNIPAGISGVLILILNFESLRRKIIELPSD